MKKAIDHPAMIKAKGRPARLYLDFPTEEHLLAFFLFLKESDKSLAECNLFKADIDDEELPHGNRYAIKANQDGVAQLTIKIIADAFYDGDQDSVFKYADDPKEETNQ